MAKSIFSIIPEADVLLSLEPEEVAGVVLEHLNSLSEQERDGLNRYNFSLRHNYNEYPQNKLEAIAKVLMEGWVWLESEGLLAPKPGVQGEWRYITRRGKKLAGRVDLEAYQHANKLPKKQLHPRLAQKVWSTFLRGDYDTAVFQAFKEVEVSVRTASGFAPEDIGASLMRKAFATSGPLTDTNAPAAEQEALAHLFAGAIGSYKNPHSHRQVNIDRDEAVEMIILASHLLKIVDSRDN